MEFLTGFQIGFFTCGEQLILRKNMTRWFLIVILNGFYSIAVLLPSVAKNFKNHLSTPYQLLPNAAGQLSGKLSYPFNILILQEKIISVKHSLYTMKDFGIFSDITYFGQKKILWYSVSLLVCSCSVPYQISYQKSNSLVTPDVFRGRKVGWIQNAILDTLYHKMGMDIPPKCTNLGSCSQLLI